MKKTTPLNCSRAKHKAGSSDSVFPKWPLRSVGTSSARSLTAAHPTDLGRSVVDRSTWAMWRMRGKSQILRLNSRRAAIAARFDRANAMGMQFFEVHRRAGMKKQRRKILGLRNSSNAAGGAESSEASYGRRCGQGESPNSRSSFRLRDSRSSLRGALKSKSAAPLHPGLRHFVATVSTAQRPDLPLRHVRALHTTSLMGGAPPPGWTHRPAAQSRAPLQHRAHDADRGHSPERRGR